MKLQKTKPLQQVWISHSWTIFSNLKLPFKRKKNPLNLSWGPFLSNLIFLCWRNYWLAACWARIFPFDPFDQTFFVKYMLAFWYDSKFIFIQINTANWALAFCSDFFPDILEHFLSDRKILALSNFKNLGQLIYSDSKMVLIDFFGILIFFRRLFLVGLELLRAREPGFDLTKIMVALWTQNKILSGNQIREELDLTEMAPIFRTVEFGFLDFHKSLLYLKD